MTQHWSITFYIKDTYRGQIDRFWNNLMALDCCIVEEHDKAGTFIGEWYGKEDDLKLFEQVPGILAVQTQQKEKQASKQKKTNGVKSASAFY